MQTSGKVVLTNSQSEMQFEDIMNKILLYSFVIVILHNLSALPLNSPFLPWLLFKSNLCLLICFWSYINAFSNNR